MIARTELRKLARARLKDAKTLLAAGSPDSAIYLCGYAVELILKARICRLLKWPGYPESNSEFKDLQSFKTHNLKILLKLSGRDAVVRTNNFKEWSGVENWKSEDRYQPIGTASAADAQLMIQCAEVLVKVI